MPQTTQLHSQMWPAEFTIFSSAARTASAESSYFENIGNFKGIRVYINATASADTPSVTFSIQVKDDVNDVYHTILTSAAVTGAAASHMEVYPGYPAAANVTISRHVGKGIRVISTAADSDSLTYSVIGVWLT